MSQELKALEDIKTWFSCHDYDQLNELETIEKALKALEIIKKKRVDVRALIEILEDEWTWEQYMDEEDDRNTGGHQFSNYRLTQEEYDLLKEVLL